MPHNYVLQDVSSSQEDRILRCVICRSLHAPVDAPGAAATACSSDKYAAVAVALMPQPIDLLSSPWNKR